MTVLQSIFNRLGIGVGMVIAYPPQSLVANLKKVLGENLTIHTECIDPTENKCIVKIANSDGSDVIYCEYTFSTNELRSVVTNLTVTQQVLK